MPPYLARAPRDVARRNVAAIDQDVVAELQTVKKTSCVTTLFEHDYFLLKALGHRNVSVKEIEQAVSAGKNPKEG